MSTTHGFQQSELQNIGRLQRFAKQVAGAAGLFALLASSSFAADLQSQKLSLNEQEFLTLDSIKITPIPNSAPVSSPCFLMMKDCPTTAVNPTGVATIKSVGTIVSIGMDLWKIVESGKPSAHIVSNSVSALPKDNPNWSMMTDWQGPLIKSYHMEAVNKMGMKVVSMDYKIMAYYGGKYQGKGQYITNLTMITDNVSVSWGYDLQATAELTDLVNTGDDENPVPGCTMLMKWRTDTLMQHREGTHSIFVKGDGSVQDLK